MEEKKVPVVTQRDQGNKRCNEKNNNFLDTYDNIKKNSPCISTKRIVLKPKYFSKDVTPKTPINNSISQRQLDLCQSSPKFDQKNIIQIVSSNEIEESGKFLPHISSEKRLPSSRLDSRKSSLIIGYLNTETKLVYCPKTLSAIVIDRDIPNKLKEKYHLKYLVYAETNFVLNGDNFFIKIAVEELEKEINSINRANVRWERLNDYGNFVPYNSVETYLIESAYIKRKKSVNLEYNGTKSEIIFGDPHYQVQSNTNVREHVRRCKESAEVKTWYWEQDSGEYQPYAAENSKLLENLYKDYQGEKLKVQGSNLKVYLIDIEEMKQTNIKTGRKRGIQRGKN